MNETRELAGFAAGLDVDGLQEETLAKLKLHLVDSIGCNIFGSTLPHCRQLIGVLDVLGGTPQATILGTSRRTSVYNAALANGTMTQGFECDDVGVYCHPGSCLAPATLAAAELAGGVAGKRLLAGLLAGYEVTIRVAESTGLYPESNIGWHTPGFHGAIGAAVCVGRVLEFDEELMHQTIGIAADIAGGGLFSSRPTAAASKRVHAGRAAATGVLSALLAAEGITGVPDVLEYEPWGYCWAMTGYSGEGERRWDLAPLTADLGERFISMERVSFKQYPTIAFNGTIMENARRIREQHHVSPDEVERIELRTIKMHVWTAVDREVDDLASANFSSKYPAVLGLLYDIPPLHESSEALSVWQERFTDPQVQQLLSRTVEVLDEEKNRKNPYSQDTTVTVHLKDGRSLEAATDYNRDNPTVGTIKLTPMTPQNVRDKFVNMASGVLGEPVSRQILEQVSTLESTDDVDTLLALLGT